MAEGNDLTKLMYEVRYIQNGHDKGGQQYATTNGTGMGGMWASPLDLAMRPSHMGAQWQTGMQLRPR